MQAKLPSELRIDTLDDGAAGLTMMGMAEAQIPARRQEEDAKVGLDALRKTQGILTMILDMLQHVRELSLQAASDMYADEERSVIQAEIAEMLRSVDVTSRSAHFEETRHVEELTGEKTGDRRTFELDDINTQALGLGELDARTQEGAARSVACVDAAIEKVAAQRTLVKVETARMEHLLESMVPRAGGNAFDCANGRQKYVLELP